MDTDLEQGAGVQWTVKAAWFCFFFHIVVGGLRDRLDGQSGSDSLEWEADLPLLINFSGKGRVLLLQS